MRSRRAHVFTEDSKEAKSRNPWPESCRDHRGQPPGGQAKQRPRQPDAPNSVVTKRERLTMSKKIKVHSRTGRITPKLMLEAFRAVQRNRMRLRSMKRKRKNYHDNRKLRVGFFRRKLSHAGKYGELTPLRQRGGGGLVFTHIFPYVA